MKILKKALLYDISNMAYVIADTDNQTHSLHRVRDVCEDGNIDRVSRVLGLAFARVLDILAPIALPPRLDVNRDNSAVPHDFIIFFREDKEWKHALTPEKKLKIKETVHEYMVSMVLADWLFVTLPPAADVWKFRAESCLETLRETVASVVSGSISGFRRRLSPF